jgi:hypothetical protein
MTRRAFQREVLKKAECHFQKEVSKIITFFELQPLSIRRKLCRRRLRPYFFFGACVMLHFWLPFVG